MFKFIRKLLKDLFQTYFSSNTDRTGYAFIVHPRDYNDVVNNVPFLRYLPRFVVFKLFPYLWPFTVSSIRGLKSLSTNNEIKGWVIGVPLFAREMIENRARAQKKINQAIRLARNKGAGVVGLGALTGSVMEGGAGLSKKGDVLVTAGRAYTSFVVKGYVDDAVLKLGAKRTDLVIAVVGAAGGVGSAVTRLIVKEDYKRIILIDLERKIDRIKEVTTELSHKNIVITHQVRAVKEADIIVTVTNAPEAVLQSDDIKPGAIIVDDAQPSDISREIIDERDDIIVVEAGVITSHEDIKVGTNFRLANKNEIYCCLGEVMAIAASGWQDEYKPGEITPDIILKLSEIGKKLGFQLAPYQAFGKMIDPDKIHSIKKFRA